MSHKVYSENPSIEMAMINTKKGVRAVFAKDGETEISVTQGDDMRSVALDFSRKCVIDKDKFIKLYIHSFPVLSDLKNSTKLLFNTFLVRLATNPIKISYTLPIKTIKRKRRRIPFFLVFPSPPFLDV